MSNIKATALDKVRASAIINTTKRFNEAQEKEDERLEKERLTQEMAAARQPKSVKKESK